MFRRLIALACATTVAAVMGFASPAAADISEHVGHYKVEMNAVKRTPATIGPVDVNYTIHYPDSADGLRFKVWYNDCTNGWSWLRGGEEVKLSGKSNSIQLCLANTSDRITIEEVHVVKHGWWDTYVGGFWLLPW